VRGKVGAQGIAWKNGLTRKRYHPRPTPAPRTHARAPIRAEPGSPCSASHPQHASDGVRVTV